MRPILLLLVFCSLAQAQAPWLPIKEQEYLKRLLPEGVPQGKNLKFYKLTQYYQSLFTMNGGNEVRLIAPVTVAPQPWVVSGGMHTSPSSEWRNATGLDIPAGKKILKWDRFFDVGAFAPVRKAQWSFPEGTIAYDVLIRRGDPERVFEVRTQTRGKNGWEDGLTYRPDVDTTNAQSIGWTWGFTNEFPDLGRVNIDAGSTVLYVPEIKTPVKFKVRREVLNDGGHLIPINYRGAGTSCASCHNSSVVAARTGYGESLRGGDGRFSWHPFLDNGETDMRWPIEIWKGR